MTGGRTLRFESDDQATVLAWQSFFKCAKLIRALQLVPEPGKDCGFSLEGMIHWIAGSVCVLDAPRNASLMQ